MAIDGLLLEYIVYIILYVYYFSTEEFVLGEFIQGCVASVFLLLGKICIALAVAEGLAGPS